MFSIFTLFLAVFFIVVFKLVIFSNGNKNRLPPGPRGLPIIGNVHQIGLQCHKTFQKWATEYGKIFSVQLGTNLAIVIDDVKMMREMLSDPVFSGKPQNELFTCIAGGNYGLLNSEGEHWEQQRRFALRHLRDLGFGKTKMQTMIMEEVKDVIKELKEFEGERISVNRRFGPAVVNSLWTICSGKRYEHNNSHLAKRMDNWMDSMRKVTESGVLFAPWLRHVIPEMSGFKEFQAESRSLMSYFNETVDEHSKTFTEGCIRDFIDSYLVEIKCATDPKSSFYGATGYHNLTASTGDIFQAGSETTSTTLAWAILYLTSHPEIQEKFRHEIDTVIGQTRLPALLDRAAMPYTEAVIMEVLRKSTIAPLGLFHRSLATKKFGDYMIPKGAWIIGNIYSIHHNEEIWGDPNCFRPERFLSDDKTKVHKHEAYIPFQVGKRACPGDPLAQDSLFLFLTSIFQRFSVSADPQDSKLDLEPQNGFFLLPKIFHVVFKDRIAQ